MYLGFLYTKGRCFSTNQVAVIGTGKIIEKDNNKNIEILAYEKPGQSVPAYIVKEHNIQCKANIIEAQIEKIDITENPILNFNEKTHEVTQTIFANEKNINNSLSIKATEKQFDSFPISSQINEFNVSGAPQFTCSSTAQSTLEANIKEINAQILGIQSNKVVTIYSPLRIEGTLTLQKGLNLVTIPFVYDKNGNRLRVYDVIKAISKYLNKSPWDVIELAVRNDNNKKYNFVCTSYYVTPEDSDNNFFISELIDNNYQPISFEIYSKTSTKIPYKEMFND